MKQNGSILIAAVLMIVVFGFVALTVADIDVNHTRAVANLKDHQDSYDIAEAGLNRAKYALTTTTSDDQIDCDDITGHADFDGESFGDGQYSVSATLFNPTATELNGSVSSSAVIIPVDSTSGYAPSGQIFINNEFLTYSSLGSGSSECGSGKNACFLGVARGQSDTDADAHSNNDEVTQNMCQLHATGAVPTLASPQSKTDLYLDITSVPGNGDERDWIVGQNHSGDLIIAGSDSTFVRKGPYDDVENKTLEGIEINSATSGWAVGNVTGSGKSKSININYWNGTKWFQATTETDNGLLGEDLPKKNLYGVTCPEPNDCWAVGTSRTFVRYHPTSDGIKWVYDSGYIDTNGSDKVENETYFGISCYNNGTTPAQTETGPTPYSCWAVGSPYSSNKKPTYVFWDGTASTPEWKKSTDYSSCAATKDIRDVYCVSGDECWAVGDKISHNPPNGCADNRVNITEWDGSEWEKVAFDDEEDPNKDLNSVTCVSADECYAVGDTYNNHGLILKFNGTSWGEHSMNVSAVPNQNLFGVSCAGPGDCLAVGDNGTIVKLTGTTWTNVTSPTNKKLYAVSMLPNSIETTASDATHHVSNWRED